MGTFRHVASELNTTSQAIAASGSSRTTLSTLTASLTAGKKYLLLGRVKGDPATSGDATTVTVDIYDSTGAAVLATDSAELTDASVEVTLQTPAALYTATATGSRTFALRAAIATAGLSVSAYACEFIILELPADAVVAQQSGSAGSSSDTYAALATVSLTAGRWLILGAACLNSSADSAGRARLLIDGASYGVGTSGTTGFSAHSGRDLGWQAWADVTLAGAATAAVEHAIRAAGVGSVTTQRAFVIALPITGSETCNTSEDRTATPMTSTSGGAKITNASAVAAGKYLLFCSLLIDGPAGTTRPNNLRVGTTNVDGVSAKPAGVVGGDDTPMAWHSITDMASAGTLDVRIWHGALTSGDPLNAFQAIIGSLKLDTSAGGGGTQSQTLFPDAIANATNLTGAVTAIDDDPDSPDASWLTATTAGTNTAVRVTFPTPSGALATGAGLQTFKALVRASSANGTPTCELQLYENGTFKRTLAGPTAVSSTTGTVLSGTWDASELSDPTGAGVELRIAGVSASGDGPAPAADILGVGVTGTTSPLAVPYPTAAITPGNIAILQVAIKSSSQTVTTPSGWSLLAGPDTSGSAIRQYLYWRVLDGSEEDTTVSVSFSSGSATRAARIYTINGARSTFTREGGGVLTGSGTTYSLPAITTTGANRFALSFAALSTSQAVGPASAGGWTEFVAEYAPSGITLHCQKTARPTAGTLAQQSTTISSASWVCRDFAVLPVSLASDLEVGAVEWLATLQAPPAAAGSAEAEGLAKAQATGRRGQAKGADAEGIVGASAAGSRGQAKAASLGGTASASAAGRKGPAATASAKGLASATAAGIKPQAASQAAAATALARATAAGTRGQAKAVSLAGTASAQASGGKGQARAVSAAGLARAIATGARGQAKPGAAGSLASATLAGRRGQARAATGSAMAQATAAGRRGQTASALAIGQGQGAVAGRRGQARAALGAGQQAAAALGRRGQAQAATASAQARAQAATSKGQARATTAQGQAGASLAGRRGQALPASAAGIAIAAALGSRGQAKGAQAAALLRAALTGARGQAATALAVGLGRAALAGARGQAKVGAVAGIARATATGARGQPGQAAAKGLARASAVAAKGATRTGVGLGVGSAAAVAAKAAALAATAQAQGRGTAAALTARSGTAQAKGAGTLAATGVASVGVTGSAAASALARAAATGRRSATASAIAGALGQGAVAARKGASGSGAARAQAGASASVAIGLGRAATGGAVASATAIAHRHAAAAALARGQASGLASATRAAIGQALGAGRGAAIASGALAEIATHAATARASASAHGTGAKGVALAAQAQGAGAALASGIVTETAAHAAEARGQGSATALAAKSAAATATASAPVSAQAAGVAGATAAQPATASLATSAAASGAAGRTGAALAGAQGAAEATGTATVGQAAEGAATAAAAPSCAAGGSKGAVTALLVPANANATGEGQTGRAGAAVAVAFGGGAVTARRMMAWRARTLTVAVAVGRAPLAAAVEPRRELGAEAGQGRATLAVAVAAPTGRIRQTVGIAPRKTLRATA